MSALIPDIALQANLDAQLDPSWAESEARQPLVRASFSWSAVFANGTANRWELTEADRWEATEASTNVVWSKDISSMDPNITITEFFRNNASFSPNGEVFALNSSDHSVRLVWIRPLNNTLDEARNGDDLALWSVDTAIIDAVRHTMTINSSSSACVGNPPQSFLDLTKSNVWINQSALIRIAPEWAKRVARTVLELQSPSLSGWYKDEFEALSTPGSVAAAFALSLANLAYPVTNTGSPIAYLERYPDNKDGLDLMDLYSHRYLEQVRAIHGGDDADLDHYWFFWVAFNTTLPEYGNIVNATLQKYTDYIKANVKQTYYRYAYLLDDLNPDVASLETITLTFNAKGLGYSPESKTVKLAMSFISANLLAAAVHMLWTTGTGRSGTASAGVSSLIMLALNSRTPDGIEDTSVGVDGRGTFKEMVAVRSNDEGSLELAFMSSGAQLGTGQVVRERARGVVQANVAC